MIAVSINGSLKIHYNNKSTYNTIINNSTKFSMFPVFSVSPLLVTLLTSWLVTVETPMKPPPLPSEMSWSFNQPAVVVS